MPFPLRIYDRETREHRTQLVEIRSIKVGRAASCDVVLDSKFVSSEQLLIRVLPDESYLLEHIGRNPTTVDGNEVPPGQAVAIRPHEEIRVANFSLFIEGAEKETKAERSASQALAAFELEVHSALVERIDLQDVASMGDERLRTDRILAVLDELVRERFDSLRTTKLQPEVVEHALRESLYSEILQELMSRSGVRESSARRGFVKRLDADAAEVVAEFLRLMKVGGTRRSLQQDLRLVDQRFEDVFNHFLETASDGLIVVLVQRFLSREILNLVCGRGPLQDLLDLPDTSEIMVVHKDLIYVERAGRLQRLHRSFITDDILIGVIQRIVDPLNRKIDKSTPLVDARLPDGSRVNAVIPPLAVRGPCLTIRKFSKDPFPIERLLELGALTQPAATFLMACVRAHKNMIISGGTGSGKTTLLNILSGFISEGERIVTIEDSAELQLRQEHVVTLETRPPNAEGRGAYTIRDLVRNALRMRPDRVIVGECRGGEALDMLQAMNTGHDGSLTTIHANTPEDALLRLETLVLEAVDLPVRAIREQIAAAIHIIVQTQRLPSGKRLVTHVSEVVGIDEVEGTIQVDDIFAAVDGDLRFSGYLPSFIQRLVDDRLLDLDTFFSTQEAHTR